MKVGRIVFVIVSILIGMLLIVMEGVDVVLEQVDGMLIALFAVITMDVVTGVITAYLGVSNKSKDGNWDNNVFYRGLLSKLLIIIVIVMATVVDYVIGNNLVRDVVILFYIFEESLSILENCSAVGLPVPAKLKAILEALKKDVEKEE
jgi:toxin secretion/phage lysis holin